MRSNLHIIYGPGTTSWLDPATFEDAAESALCLHGVGQRSHDIDVSAYVSLGESPVIPTMLMPWIAFNFYRLSDVDIASHSRASQDARELDAVDMLWRVWKQRDTPPDLVMLFISKTDKSFWAKASELIKKQGTSIFQLVG